MVVICVLVVFSLQVHAEGLTLKQAIKQGVSSNSTLREYRYKINNLQRKSAKLQAKMFWQVDLAGGTNYKRETVKEPNELGEMKENIEKRKQVNLNLQGNRTFGWGLKLNPTLSLTQEKLESKAFDFDNLEDKIEADLTLTQRLYPWIPSELRQECYSVQVDLQRAKDKLNWQRKKKKIDWTAAYLNLLRLQQKKKIAVDSYKLAKQNLEQVKHQQEIQEAGETKVLQAKIRVKKAKESLVKAKNDFKQAKKDWLQELGYNQGQKIVLEKSNSYLKTIRKKAADLNIEKMDSNQLIKKVEQVHPDAEYKRNKKELVTKQLKWAQAEGKPKFELTGNYDYQSEDWKVGININYNLFDSGYQELSIKDYQDQLVKLKKDYQNLVKSLEVQLNNLLNQLQQAELKLKEEKVKLEKLKLEKKLFKKQLQAGGIVEDKFKQKKNQFRQARVDIKIKKDQILINKLRLMRFLGQGDLF